MLRAAAVVTINYEGEEDPDLQRAVVDRLMPLVKGGSVFKPFCNAFVPSLKAEEPACGMIQLDGGMPKPGVSLDSFMAYLASKDKFPPGAPREFLQDHVGYWIGTERGKKVHAILLLG